MKIRLKKEFEKLAAEAIGFSSEHDFLQILVNRFPNQIIFSTSFSYEDQVVTHLIKNYDIDLFTLDTGRLFEQTYETWNATRVFFKKQIKTYYPNAETLNEFVSEYGPDSFYQSVENRKKCCHIRKVEPMKKALENYRVWITGLRSEHSLNRKNMSWIEWDDDNEIIKFHPILKWSHIQVIDYVKDHHLPYNNLHKKGFASIGCAPCTRAIREGEDFRAGRWWWEDVNKKECGLHIHK